MKIVFFATSNFAIPALNAIQSSSHKIVAVYTKSAKKQGRGLQFENTPIFTEASKYNLNIFTPKSLKNKDEIEKLKSFSADIFVVVAYGLILPEEILNIAKYGCINIHPSLLPRWRGASPIQRTLMSGDKETGICIIQVGTGIDDGNILCCKKMNISQNETFESLQEKLSIEGSKLILSSLNDIEKNQKITSFPQSNKEMIYATKIEKEEGKLNFNNNIEEIDLLIRTLGNNLGTFFEINGERIKILKASIRDLKENENNLLNGTIINSNLEIKCQNGILCPLILQKEGKKALNVADFARGFKVNFVDGEL